MGDLYPSSSGNVEDAIVAEIPFRVLEAGQSAVILRACLLRFRESARGHVVQAVPPTGRVGWYLVLAATMEAGSSLTME